MTKSMPEGEASIRLLVKNSTAKWLKKYLQNLKGRGLDSNFRNGEMGWLARVANFTVDVGYIKLLALNINSAVKNLVAGEANSFIYQDFWKYLRGKQRFISSPYKAIKMALDYGILEGTYADFAVGRLGRKFQHLRDITMVGQKAGEYEIRSTIFAAELTPEEWATKNITSERLRKIKDVIAITQGIFSKIDTPLWIQTWFGRVLFQMNRWRITNAMLFRRVTLEAASEIKKGNFKGSGTRRLLKMFFMYGLGMWLSYEFVKAGVKKIKIAGQDINMEDVAKSMSESINNLINLFPAMVRSLSDNPTYSVLKEMAFTIQGMAAYLGADRTPFSIEFRRGIEETRIKPLEAIFGRPTKEKSVGGLDFGFGKGKIQGITPLNFNF